MFLKSKEMRALQWILCTDSTSESPLAPGILTAKGLCIILGTQRVKKKEKQTDML